MSQLPLSEKEQNLDKFKEFVENFEWRECASGGELCWSANRDNIDIDRFCDDVIASYGNDLQIKEIARERRGISCDGFFYFLERDGCDERVRGGSPTMLLRRVSWDKIIMIDANYISVNERKR